MANKKVYKVDLARLDNTVVAPCVAQFTRKKDALKFAAQMNRTSSDNHYNRKAMIRVLEVWKPVKR